jgi:hypothetical protein
MDHSEGGSSICGNRCAFIAVHHCAHLLSGATLRAFYENRAETTSRFYAAQAYLDNRMTIRSVTDLALRGYRVPQAAVPPPPVIFDVLNGQREES